ncbi:PadR family transcriptional regulator [Halomicroarcula sp. F13]|uniref:PadR family transcriptional regulator n=1 Tax=Haloarcula rubra TaxID=2487747 RepID=A0AAW4PWI9_9EURY|nr:helix-turn-helix transcriptional regulator [Halomicroarcula rubra]MBX0325549.1 PadR family transcriptional regulator [Halomicroarcula rubra]
MDGLTGFQRDILYALVGLESPHGLAVQAELDEYYSESVTRGRLYANLDELVDRGFVHKERQTDRSNQYTLTDHGVRAIVAHRRWTEQQLLDALQRGGQ